MGTNYYIHYDVCEHCGKAKRVWHIGKKSAGWCFTLHVEPSESINTLDDIIPMMYAENSVIKNEYGETFSASHMLSIIKDLPPTSRPQLTDDDVRRMGYRSIQNFYDLNSAEPGPCNLLRHKISDHCIGHGPGPYDYIRGEFA